MLKQIKTKIDESLSHNQYAINRVDYGRLKAYIDLLYTYASPYSNLGYTKKDLNKFIKNN